jgi:hypothetical protein
MQIHNKIFSLIIFLTCSCGARHEKVHLFTLLPSSSTHATFVNELDYKKQLESGFNIYTFRNFYNGAGVGLGDINNDGFTDIFMTSNMGRNKLYLNKGNFRFEDISVRAGIEGSGWSTGVAFADVNGDGLPDIYVCKSGNIDGSQSRNELFINNGDLTFSEQASAYGINEQGNSTQAVFFDHDKDGDLDMYLLKNFPKPIGSFNLKENQREIRDTGGGDKLFRNDSGKFTDVSASAGIYGSVIGFGLGVAVGDIDLDGWPDIYVANDFFERDYLYLNNHDGTFSEKLTGMMSSVSAASMGGDMADINNDCYPEIFATDMLPEHNDRLKTKTTFDNWDNYSFSVKNGYHHQFTRNVLQLNNGDGTFSEIGRFAGISATDWSWGALIMDLDNDGLKDIFVANGIFKDLTDQDYISYFSDRDMVMSIVSGNKVNYRKLIDGIPSVKISNFAFKNIDSCRFENMSAQWGLADPGFSNGAAYGDLDNDGDLDLIVNNVNMPMFIYRNESEHLLPDNHFIKIILKGEYGNTEAIGAKITARHHGKTFYVEQMPIRGYLSTVDPRPNIGVGALSVIDTLVIEWPDDRVTILNNVKTDQTITLYQKDAADIKITHGNPSFQSNLFFRDISSQKRINFIHRENEFNDFQREKLIYNMLSTEGPHICKGDMNNDGLEDIFIGGAKDQAGVLMFQSKDGTFENAESEALNLDKISEDTDCGMFDADNDGDMDLYVASGGNEFPESSSALSDRLYLNDGKGRLRKSDQILPAGKYESSSCVRPEDFDKDGIIELFLGIRLKPFSYGIPVNGYLLENDGKGNFRNVTSDIAPALLNVGMIKDMQWCDVDNDGDKDIVLAGDWMPIKIFLNDNGQFREKKNVFGLNTTGWWNCITIGDFNNDGNMDFVAGNLGLNSRFKASSEKPVSMYVNDFDLNGAVDQIICSYDGDKSYPVALKHDITGQIPYLKTKYRSYESYKDQQITDIFTAEELKSAIRLDVCLTETSLFLNDGHGQFFRKKLPPEVQYSPVYAAESGDFDGDGNSDLILGGNLYNVKPEVGRYDAGYGLFLKGNGLGGFISNKPKKSGLLLKGEIRDFLPMKTSKGNILVVAGSNVPVQVFEILSPDIK